MSINLSVQELPAPVLEFGGAAMASDIKGGLLSAGPFDLRFGSARTDVIPVGIIGPAQSILDTKQWLSRCEEGIAALRDDSKLRRSFEGFSRVFRKTIATSNSMTITLGSDNHDVIGSALKAQDPFLRFKQVLTLYTDALERLAARETNRPQIVLICLPPEIRKSVGIIERTLGEDAKKIAKEIAERKSSQQLDLLDLLEDVDEAPDDLMKRDFRNALKAKALELRLPIQIVTRKLTHDTMESEDAATRAWNFSVGLYYKSGGVPWRVRPEGPSTCFVGISFHHVETAQKHIVQSSLAHAFSSDGEGFAIRGGGVPVEPGQKRALQLSYDQSYNLGEKILSQYRLRTGSSPLRIVIHKSSAFSEQEIDGFQEAFSEVPIVSLITLVPSSIRLFRFGQYPPKVGTVCSLNGDQQLLYTTGLVPELGTYPGSHIPQPMELRGESDEPMEVAARDIFNLTRMNWNTADLKGRMPVTLSFARRVGGILNEFGDRDPEETSFRYFI